MSRIVQLWRYPVKSMSGEPVDALQVTGDGVVGDRRFALALRDGGRILSAKREPRLLEASARWFGDGEATIVLPDGRTLHTADPDIEAVLSRWLGVSIRLARVTGEVRTVADYAGDLADPARLSSFDLPSWGFADEAPLHLISEGSLRAARQQHPAGDWDPRRFRPNVLIASRGEERTEPPPGDEPLRLGEAVVRVGGPCRRCVMVTQPQPGLVKDRQLLRTVLDRFGAELGVYADVVLPGWIRVGDHVAGPGVRAETGARR